MKTTLTITLLFLLLQATNGQNLVPNPSFEEYTLCPNNECQIYKATGWQSFGYTPDYYNACGSPYWSVPQNIAGYQFAATGNAYIGIGTYSTINNVREYIGIQLLNPLIIGKKYYVNFKAVRFENSNCATNKLGVLFSTVSYALDTLCLNITLLLAPNHANLYENTIITDTANWTSVSDSIVADSSYQYMIIGNLFDNVNTDTIKFNTNPCASGYFLDDIYVGEIPNVISEISNENSVNIQYSENLVSIEINPVFSYVRNTIVKIYNLLGKQVFFQTYDYNNIKVNINNLPKDMYIVYVLNADKIYSKKIIK